MTCKTVVSFFMVLSALASVTALGQSSKGAKTPTTKTTTKTTTTNKKDFESAENKTEWGGSLSYDFRTDLLKQDRPDIANSIGGEVSLKSGPNWIYGASTSVGYNSAGSNVRLGNDNPYFDDISFSAGRGYKLSENNNLRTTYIVVLPSGTFAQYEQYKGIFIGKFDLSTKMTDVVTLNNSARLGGFAQTLDYSPVTKTANVVAFAAWKVGFGFKLGANLGMNIGAGLKSASHTDNVSTISGATSISGNYKYQKWGFSLAYSNSSYQDDGPARLWNIDQFQQLVSGGLSYEF